MKRRVKKIHWCWVVASLIIAVLWCIPLPDLQVFVEDTEEKIKVFHGLIETLATTTKAATSLVIALAAFIFYRARK